MAINDINIYRIYKCLSCAAEVSYHQKCTAPYLIDCPLCNKPELLFEKGVSSLSTLIDTKTPKTFGSISQKNKLRREKYEDIPHKKRPNYWWRKDKNKIDFTVLKDSKKYIETGSN